MAMDGDQVYPCHDFESRSREEGSMNTETIIRCKSHEWVVFSTCLGTVELMVECAKCGAFGTVASPTQEEWSEAFHAPSKPYAWHDPSRVTIREPGGIGPYYVRRNPELN
jgi:hypothetical protein